MKKIKLFFANILFLFHIVLGIVIIFGWIFSTYRLEYLLLLTSWMACWIFLGYCPFTKWELLLRGKTKVEAEAGEFIQHYVDKFFNKKIPQNKIFIGGMFCFILFITLSFLIR